MSTQLIYSSKKKDILLLAINRFEDISNARTDMCPATQFLQVYTKKMKKGDWFADHSHNPLERVTTKTQEGWIVLGGKINARFLDIDDTLIYETVLTAGDCAVVFDGGHGFEVLEEDTILYEFKTGPYYGVEKDKTFIGDKEKSR